ncbi:hypothetical protein A2U01_0023286, partial [Trifolium medium]|nr:hypothetical protein [Trifolium medium]
AVNDADHEVVNAKRKTMVRWGAPFWRWVKINSDGRV